MTAQIFVVVRVKEGAQVILGYVQMALYGG